MAVCLVGTKTLALSLAKRNEQLLELHHVCLLFFKGVTKEDVLRSLPLKCSCFCPVAVEAVDVAREKVRPSGESRTGKVVCPYSVAWLVF